MALYQNGILISGANTLPQMTLAEYQALPVSERPTYWERTDLNYNNIPASDVTYGSGSVEDALDEMFVDVTLAVNETIQDGAANSKTFVMGTAPTGYKGIGAYFERDNGQGGNSFELFPYVDNGNVRINVQNLTGSPVAIIGTLHFVFAKF